MVRNPLQSELKFATVLRRYLDCGPVNHFPIEFEIMDEFILETNYPSRRIIRQTDNSSKYKSVDEF